ncbi:MAG: cyclic nucleotide-binding and patatin-like phospholipase domain-containing protein [Ilumatobacteraceae bacterium]
MQVGEIGPVAGPRATAWTGAVERVLEPGDVLVREGEPGDDVFELVAGRLEVLRGAAGSRIDTIAPGTVIGEIAALARGVRTATVRAVERSTVRQLDGEQYRRWLATDEASLDALTDIARFRIDRHTLIEMVGALLAVDHAVAAGVVDTVELIRVDAGNDLFQQGDESDAAYILVSGRLQAWRDGAVIGEIGRGEFVGEAGLIEGTSRSATITALRDCTLGRIDMASFQQLAATSPAMMLQLARTVVSRLGRPTSQARARSVAVVVTAALDVRRFVSQIADEIGRRGSTRHLWASRVDAELGRPGLVESGSSVTRPALAEHLQDVEASHRYLVLEADADGTNWTRQSFALADRIVVVSSATPDAAERRRVAAALAVAPDRARVERWLAVVHPSSTTRPLGAASLADDLGCDRVANLRSGSAADIARLARLVSGNGTGLVLGGGGARGFAHLGVWRALWELGVEIDAIAGASIGAPLGAAMALQIAPDELDVMVADLFRGLLDYTVPVVSLIKGERISRNIATVFAGVDVRDLWLPFSCVSTNLTKSRVEVHDRLDAATAIRASVAIPGVLPPVPFGGDLLVDGGVLNNLPCDVMRGTGMVDRLIAVDLSPPAGPGAQDDFGLSVSGWRALRAHFGPGPSRYPGFMAILMRALVAGSVRDRDQMLAEGLVDWYLDLDLRGIQLLDFERVAEIAQRGYDVARPRLATWLAEERTG